MRRKTPEKHLDEGLDGLGRFDLPIVERTRGFCLLAFLMRQAMLAKKIFHTFNIFGNSCWLSAGLPIHSHRPER